MAIAFVDDCRATGAGSTAVMTVPAGGFPVGSLVVVHGACHETTDTTTGVSDSDAVNTYTFIPACSGTIADGYLGVYYCVVTDAIEASDTITLQISAANGCQAIATCWTGIAASPLDQSNSEAATSETTHSSPSVTTTQADELLIGAHLYRANGTITWTPTGSWALPTAECDYDPASYIRSILQYRIVAATGSYASTGTTSSTVTPRNSIATFKAEAAGGQTLAPSADSVDGNWTNQAGSATDLFDAINETTASDTDYIRSELGPANSPTRIKLASGGDPASSSGHEINWRIAKDAAGGQTIGMIVKLYQGGGNSVGGGTLIASFTRSNVTNTFTDFAEALSAGEADSITNYADLYLEFWANAT